MYHCNLKREAGKYGKEIMFSSYRSVFSFDSIWFILAVFKGAMPVIEVDNNGAGQYGKK